MKSRLNNMINKEKRVYLIIILCLFVVGCASPGIINHMQLADDEGAVLVNRPLETCGVFSKGVAEFRSSDRYELSFNKGWIPTKKARYRVPPGRTTFFVFLHCNSAVAYGYIEVHVEEGESYFIGESHKKDKAQLWIYNSKGEIVSNKIESLYHARNIPIVIQF